MVASGEPSGEEGKASAGGSSREEASTGSGGGEGGGGAGPAAAAQRSTPTEQGAAAAAAEPALVRRQGSQAVEAEVAAMLTGLTGGAEGGSRQAGAPAAAAAGVAAAAAAAAAAVESTEGIPVLPDVVRNKDLKRDLPLTCHIVGCGLDLTAQADYYQRHRICKAHLKAPAMLVDGILQRFCQQCGRFHELKEFDSDKRNCRARLQQHNSRRRKVFAMTQELKRAKSAKSEGMTEVSEGMTDAALAAAVAAAAAVNPLAAWHNAGLPALPAASEASGGGLPSAFAGLPALPLPPMPVPEQLAGKGGLDPAALAAALQAAGSALEGMASAEGQKAGGRVTGAKRAFSALEAAGSLRGDEEGGSAGQPTPDALLSERYHQLLVQQQLAERLAGGRDGPDSARLYGRSSSGLSNPFSQQRRSSSPPPASEGPLGAAGGPPSSTLLEQMARRVLLSGGGNSGHLGAAPRPASAPVVGAAASVLSGGSGGGGPGGPSSWLGPPEAREHPDAQALGAVYPELAAQIQLLSQQLQAVQAQLAAVMPSPEDSAGGGGAAAGGLGGLSSLSAGGAPTPSSWEAGPALPGVSAGRLLQQQASMGRIGGLGSAFGTPHLPGWQAPAPSAVTRQTSLQTAASGGFAGGGGGGGYTAEDLLKAYMAGMQQSSSGGRGEGTAAALEALLSKGSGGLGLPSALADRAPSLGPSSRSLTAAAAARSAAQDDAGLPPSAFAMLQTLLGAQPGSPTRGASGGSSAGRALHAEAAAEAGGAGSGQRSTIEQLSAALGAAGGAGSGGAGDAPTGGRRQLAHTGSSNGRGAESGSLPMADVLQFISSMRRGSGGL